MRINSNLVEECNFNRLSGYANSSKYNPCTLLVDYPNIQSVKTCVAKFAEGNKQFYRLISQFGGEGTDEIYIHIVITRVREVS